MQQRLTLVAAPAGYGKTTLLSEVIRDSGIPAGWLTLDEGENDPASFLSYFIAALQTVRPGAGESARVLLQAPQLPPIAFIVTNIINEMSEVSEEFALVLDDYHVIESQPIHEALTLLLNHLPPQAHLVIASRTDPPIPLAQLRARGQLVEVRVADLRFIPEEAAAFLHDVMGLDLSAEDVSALDARTEGWIASLQLAAVSMQGREDIHDFIAKFSGSSRYIMDYLTGEVLDRQEANTQAFLLETAILDRFTAPLCDAITGRNDGREQLARLETSNLFLVPLDDERQWYRYHHLFADLLRQRLYHYQPDKVAELHLRASAWYEENGLDIEALHHAAAAGDIDRGARLIEGNGNSLYHRGAVLPVLSWLESLPSEILAARPELDVMYAEVLMTRGRFAEAEERYRAAEASLQNAAPDAETRDLLGRIANGRASMAAVARQPEQMLALAHRALELLRPDNLPIRAAASLSLGLAYKLQNDRAAASQAFEEAIEITGKAEHIIVTLLATINLGHMQLAANSLNQAAATYRRALQLAGEPPVPYIGEAYRGLACIDYERSNLDTALQHLEQAIGLTRLLEYDESIPCEVLLARLRLAQGDIAGAIAALDEAEQHARDKSFLSRLPEIAAAKVFTLLRQGNPADAAGLTSLYDIPLSRARVEIAGGDTAAALATLESLLQRVEANHWDDERLKVMVLQAIALQAHGDDDQAVQMLEKALIMAEPEGFVRNFIDEGAPMEQLLYKAAARGIRPAYAGKLLAAFETETSEPHPPVAPSSQPLVEPLSQRELEVLSLAAKGLSNQAIGQRLFLALSTVKGHNRNIFGKLGVRNRTQAVHKARALNILPPQ